MKSRNPKLNGIKASDFVNEDPDQITNEFGTSVNTPLNTNCCVMCVHGSIRGGHNPKACDFCFDNLGEGNLMYRRHFKK